MKTNVIIAYLVVVFLYSGMAYANDKAPKTPSKADVKILDYLPTKTLEGKLISVGSDSMADLVQLWVKAYKKHQPDIAVEVQSQGSAAAPPALIEGTANLGPMARPMKVAELAEFKAKYGFEPSKIRTVLAAVAIYVSPENPIAKLSFEELDAIFSSSHKRGLSNKPVYWKDLGVNGKFGENKIKPVILSADSPLQSYFKQQVMLQGDFIEDSMSTTDTKSLLQAIAANPGAIGFGEVIQTKVDGKIVAITKDLDGKEQGLLPSSENLLSGVYPLSRYLNIYFVRYPGEPLDPTLKDFMKFVLSTEGQKIATMAGMVPLSAEVVAEEVKKLD